MKSVRSVTRKCHDTPTKLISQPPPLHTCARHTQMQSSRFTQPHPALVLAKPSINRTLNTRQFSSMVDSNQATQSTQASPPNDPIIHSVFEQNTGTWQYILVDSKTSAAVIIDPVLDYDRTTQEITTRTADALLLLISTNNYKVERILETHAHADHLTAASYLQRQIHVSQGFKPLICIGKRIPKIQEFFAKQYDIPENEYMHIFDSFLEDGETIRFGDQTLTAMHLPGHTPDHLGYKIGGTSNPHYSVPPLRLLT